ncbi:GMC oxidoreductase [Rothia sp. ZJ932]|uniref:GMC oxidoreductase n=1 Tax=Rothia sp. ZJ932 TaxID=2810516 RepID=UPI00196898BC|nr:GMC oxidoreductase [Rothia sp. ZJ932]QRZ61611.1 GMC family oxidoreductase [Rothia sp. ZJ932]
MNTPNPRIAIIGSGYGGAVAAYQLTQAGYSVELIEMGADWEKIPAKNGKKFTSMVSPSERSMWFKDRTDMPLGSLMYLDIVNKNIDRGPGVLDIEKFEHMKVYVGRGVGGGSLVNGGMAVTPDRAFFEHVLPSVDADEMYATYFPLANQLLSVEEPPKDLLQNSKWYGFSRVGVAHATKAGFSSTTVPNVYDWDYMREESFNNVPRSALDGQVIFGNDHGKKSLPKTLLAHAFATGRVKLREFTEVVTIQHHKDNSTFSLTLNTINASGETTGRTVEVYDKVILAAGSIGTSKLLTAAKARNTIEDLPEETGKKWGPNGNIMTARWLGLDTTTGCFQSGIPANGVTNWDGSEQSVFAEVAPFPAGIETHTSLYLAITNNPNLADFTWNEEKQATDLNWDSKMAEPSVTSTRNFFDTINRANPGTGYRYDLFEGGAPFADYFSYHPLGGMILNEATDNYGEVKNVPGLFVMDGSLIPGKIGVNPFVTITALALRNINALLTANRFTTTTK